MFNLGSYTDIKTLITDPSLAESKGLTVKKCRVHSPKLQKLEEAMKAIPNDAENWREQVDNLKRSIQEEKNNLTRYLIKYKKASLNAANYLTLGLFRSVITDGEKILSIAPPKSLPYDLFTTQSAPEDQIYQEFCEGTMINMYYDSYTEEWEIATRSNIGARCKFYNPNSTQTFRRMFLDAFTKQHLEFHHFDKKNCYSFVLQHPENRIVVPYTVPKIVLTNVYQCSSQEVREIPPTEWSNVVMEGHHVPSPSALQPCEYYQTISAASLSEAFSQSKVLDYTIQGAVVRDQKSGFRYKVRNPHYEYVRHLRGNNPKLQYQYYHLRQNGQVKKYLQFYPEELDTFTRFRDQLHKWTTNLHRNYVACYIQKEKPLREFPFEYRSHMYKLHEHYRSMLREEGGAITRRVVINYVNNLPPNHLMASINYPLKHINMKAKCEELEATGY